MLCPESGAQRTKVRIPQVECHKNKSASANMRKLTYFCDPSGIRTRVTAVRGRRTRPLYDGASDLAIMARGRYAGIIRSLFTQVSIRRYAATQPAKPSWLRGYSTCDTSLAECPRSGCIEATRKTVSIRRYAATQPATPSGLSAHEVGVSKPQAMRFRYAATRLLNLRHLAGYAATQPATAVR
jgi:hypothetical protein